MQYINLMAAAACLAACVLDLLDKEWGRGVLYGILAFVNVCVFPIVYLGL